MDETKTGDVATQSAGENIAAGLKSQEAGGKAPEDAAAKPNEVKPEGAEELKQLRDRLAKLETDRDAVTARREAADTVDTFIREKMQDLPTELVRKLLPATKDQTILLQEEQRIRSAFSAYIAKEVKRLETLGTVTVVKNGGGGGGASITEIVPPKNQSAFDNIHQALRQRQY